MKVLAVLIGLVSLTTAELPSGTDYFGEYLCPPPSQIPASSDTDSSCTACTTSGDCSLGLICCASNVQDCRTCSPGFPTAVQCTTDTGVASTLEFTLDEDDCEYCVCVGGEFYCREEEREEDGSECPSLTAPTEGGSCMIEDQAVQLGDITLINSDDDCQVCVCGNGVLFCKDCNTAPMCMYNGERVEVGQTVPADDSCNRCTCDSPDNLICTEMDCACGGDLRRFNCLIAPCESAMCPAQPNATCFNDYCGGCNARWMVRDEDVSHRCFNVTPPEPLEPTQIATCPHVDLDTCVESCSNDTGCSDGQICCRGCGSSCRDPVNLPFFELPQICPPFVPSFSTDSSTCDIQCSFDDQCPGDKICCSNGCSRSCQTGYDPPNLCYLIQQAIEQDSQDLLGRFHPRCIEGGYFSPKQFWEGTLWCVNVVTGRPIGHAYSVTDEGASHFTCPNCTYKGEVYYPGQNFTDECNTCFCSESGVAACTDRACLSPCTEPLSLGTCEDIQIRYFFDRERSSCERFPYTGCGGNANQFISAGDCLEECLPESICLQEWDEGELCDGEEEDRARKEFYYYYNAEEGQCNNTLGYRCGGNVNRFQTLRQCLEACDPTNPGPTDIYGTPCIDILCDIPFCGEGVDEVYSDDHCCPTCPTAEGEECQDNQFRCRDGSCIQEGWRCDGLVDCDDGSDEIGDRCALTIIDCDFHCSEDECIPEDLVCNGVPECSNARDEVGCTTCAFVRETPFYEPPTECPAPTDVQGDCGEDQCAVNSDCHDGELCCVNNCNQRSCIEPMVTTHICRTIEQSLQGINVSYTPQCDSSGDFQSEQCMGEGVERRCWCVDTLFGVPFTNVSTNTNLDCHRCTYDGSEYFPGDIYTANDGCNTCICGCNGRSDCTRRRCAEDSCRVPSITEETPDSLDHGETREFDCIACTCMFGELNCTSARECDVDTQIVRLELTFGGEIPDDIPEFERAIVRSLLQQYGESMQLQQDQVEVIEVRSGSVIIVVEIKDEEDGANVTFLAYQVEDDFNDGILVIRYENEAYVPSGNITVERVSQEEVENDDDEGFAWYYGVIIGVGVLALILITVVFAIIVLAFKRNTPNNKIESHPNECYSEVEMKKVPLDNP